MTMQHEMERRHWPADLPDRNSVVSVFQAYGSGIGHIAVVRNRNSEFWFACNCGTGMAPIRADHGTFRAVLDKVEGMADQHIEQTRG